jgi:hypothetical protein
MFGSSTTKIAHLDLHFWDDRFKAYEIKMAQLVKPFTEEELKHVIFGSEASSDLGQIC